jgi:sugar phosphate isomerase/epimerase
MPTRRLFLSQVAAAWLPATEKFWKTAIGLNGFGSAERAYKRRYELDDILKYARDDGFDGIELWGNFHGPYPDPNDDTAVSALRRHIESFHLQIFSIQSAPRGGRALDVDPEQRRAYTRALSGQIDLAKKLGCVCAGMWPPALAAAKDLTEDQIIDRLAECIRPVVRHAVEQGITLSIEGEPPLVINTPARYQKLFAAVGMKEFKVIFDPSHFDLLTGGKCRPDILLRELGVERVGYVQLTDGDGTLRTLPNGRTGTSKHLAAGEGKYDIAGLLDILYGGGYRGWIQMDTWETEDPFKASTAGRKAVEAARRKYS